MKICFRCKEEKSLSEFYAAKGHVDGHSSWCITCCKKRVTEKLTSEEGKARRRELKVQSRVSLIRDLGGSCVCCGETTYEFLEIDHIHNNGAAWKKRFGVPYLTPSHLRTHIEELQVLCGNCHNAKSYHDNKCPHQLRSVEMK